jgi:2-amino-4-hydroxy-6-hydroxymethyldihydropteridine diphosphokinase
MARVFLGIGSNVSPIGNLRLGVRELQRQLGDIRISPVYRSRPLGFEGDDFLNAVVALDTEISPDEVLQVIEKIHARAGRQRDAHKLVSRTLDIDLLLYDDLVLETPGLSLPRSDVLSYSFVLRPLAELAPDASHPVTGRTFQEHWRQLKAGEGEGGVQVHPLEETDVNLLEDD